MFVLFCYALLCVYSRFAIILKRKGKLVALLLSSFRCIVTLNVMWLFLTVPWVGLQHMIVVFPDHTHVLSIILKGLKSNVNSDKVQWFFLKWTLTFCQ